MSRLSDAFNDERDCCVLVAALAQSLPHQRWFARKGEAVSAVVIDDAVILNDQGTDGAFGILFANVTSETTSDHPDCYIIPVAMRVGVDEDATGVLLRDGDRAVVECSSEPAFWRCLLQQTELAPIRSLRDGTLSFAVSSERWLVNSVGLSQIAVSSVEQSNTAVTLGEWGFLKLFRRVEAGINPDVEIGRFLTQTAPTVHTPNVLGTLDYRPVSGGDALSVAILLEQVAAESDAWQFTLSSLAGFWHRVAERSAGWSSDRIETEAVGSSLADQIGPYLDAVRLLGRRTAELHSALASGTDAAFHAEPLTDAAITEQRERVTAELAATCRLLQSTNPSGITTDLAIELQAVGDAQINELTRRLNNLQNVSLIRVHGDYHLGQVLRTRDDFVIIDFEGEPDRPLAERREKRCVLKDVAGMIRSLHYASNAASVGLLPSPSEAIVAPETWQKQWYAVCRSAFLDGYFESLTAPAIIPEDPAATQTLLDLFVLEKALYELRYEINHRPDWIAIPLAGLSELFQINF